MVFKEVINRATDYLSSPQGLETVKNAGQTIGGYIPGFGIRRKIGIHTGGAVGRWVGGAIGHAIGTVTGNAEKGRDIGSKFAEATLGFKKGGLVRKSGKYLVHRKEYILTKKQRPTKSQRKIVKRRNKKK